MIGKIIGNLEEIDGNLGYVNTGFGICYLCYLTPNLLTKSGQKVSIYTYLDIKQDSQILYGFDDKKQYKIYKQLILIDGVGPKTGYIIVCSSHPDEIYNAVLTGDVSYFSQIKGIGQKTAQRIILELSHVLKKSVDLENLEVSGDDKIVLDALKSLGFDGRNTIQVMRRIDKKDTIENKIKSAIKLLTSK